MSDAIWPTIRLRLGEVFKWLAAAALMATIAGFLAWNPDNDYRQHAEFPDAMSRSQSVTVVARVAPVDDELAPAKGASWTLYRTAADDIVDAAVAGDLVEVESGKADGDGIFSFEMPRYSEQLEPRDDGSISFVLHTQFDGEDHYRQVRYTAPPTARVFLTLDRPLYQPGQTVDLRLLATFPDSGEPRVIDLIWEVFDPQDNLVKQVESTTSKLGIASTSFALASGGLQGQYRVEVRESGEEVEGAEPLATATFDVRPFRLPRFTVDVLFSAPSVSAGDIVRGRAVARYTYGEPVAEEDVTVVLTVNGGERTTVTGVTDAAGEFGFEWQSPEYFQGSLTAEATVQTEAGRMEKGSGAVGVLADRSAGSYEVELIPSRKVGFTQYEMNTGYLLLTKGGEPVSNTKVKLYLPEEETEREITVTTDARGLASFTWSPHGGGAHVTAIVFGSNGEQRVEIWGLGGHGSNVIAPRNVVLDVGETIEVDVDLALLGAGFRAIVVLTKDGAIVAKGNVDQDSVGRLTVPPQAVGLYWLEIRYFHESGDFLKQDTSRIPIWVKQPGGSEVELTFDKKEYRPGEGGTLELAFPAQVKGKTGQSDVAFGLVAVDEALYALAERPSVALHLAAREDPATIGVVSAALPQLLAAQDKPEAVQNVAMTRYLRQLQSLSPERHYSRSSDITRDVRKASGHLPAAIWVVFCLALILVFSGFAARNTVQSFRSKRSFTWKRLFAQFGLAVAALIVAAAFGIGGEKAFLGGAAMWCIISVGWLLGAGWRTRGETNLFAWTLVTLGGVWVWGCGLLGGWQVFNAYGDFGTTYVVLGAAIPGALWLLEAFLWVFVMLREREWNAAASLSSFVSVILVLPLGLFTMGSRDAHYYKAAPAMEEMEVAQGFGGAARPEAAMDDSDVSLEEKKVAEGAPDPGGAPGDAAPAGPRVRSWFPETMIWVAEVLADETGVARLPIEFPDSITTWRFDAWANTSDGRFGSGQAQVRTIQTFFVEVELPTHLISGDVIEVPVTIANRSDEPVMARLSTEADGSLKLRRPLPSQVVVAPRKRALFKMTVAADGVGAGGVIVTASTDESKGGDAVRREVSVAPDGAIITSTQSGIVADGFSPSINVPLSTIPETSSIEVGLYPSVMADAVAGLESMLREPMGCFEQTSSANYPNVLVLKTLRANSPSTWPGGEKKWEEAESTATEFVELGYQRMLTFQKSGGGFALYPSNDEADPMLTGYGLLQLAEMRDVTLVDEAFARRAVRWLETIQDQNGSWPVWSGRVSGGAWRSDSDPGQVRSTSFIVMGVIAWKELLSDSGAIERALDRIEERLPSVRSPDTLAYAANALLMGGRKDAARSVLTRLDAIATRDGGKMWWGGGGATWMGARDRYSDVETTAVAGWAIVELGEKPQWSRALLQFLAESRMAGGGWGTTQATVWTLRTFEKLRKLDDGEMDVTVQLDGAPMQRSSGEGSDGVARIGGASAPLLHGFAAPTAAGESELSIVPPNGKSTTAMVQATTRYAVPWDSREAAAAAGALALDWRVSSRSLQLGKPVEVVATVENSSNDWIANAIIELPIPPGAYVDLDEVRRRFSASNVELIPTHIRVYLDELPPGSRQPFPYAFVPMVRGRMSVPPMRAYPFYSPVPVSELDSGDVATQ